jgi:hypothetical protein
MGEPETIELSRLREIGWREWDPIGLAGSGCPPDEYDRYLLQVVNRLRRGDSVREVADYLDNIGAEWMGLGPSTAASRVSAETTVLQIKGYLDTLPPGPLKVR